MSRRLFRAFVSLLVVASGCSQLFAQTQDALLQQRKLTGVFNYLNNMYVDETDMAPLVERAIESMLDELDPHSSYISAKEMKSVQENFDGEFSGIGIEFNVHRDTIMVVNVIAGAPAESVGIRPNDRIVTIDGENAVGMKRGDVPSKLRGKTGTTVCVGIIRHGCRGITEYDIVRGRIPINTVDAAYLINETAGYIKVNRFGRTTADEFTAALGKLGNIRSLILDLRGNGGGMLEQAIEMAGFFLPHDALIVSTEGRSTRTQQYYNKRRGNFVEGDVIVLLDETSASASEIVAGALQDWDRGIVIGAPSFGKGLVQRQIMLPDSSAVRITVSRYHTPTGRVIQRPYENGKREAYYQAHRDRMTNHDSDTLAAEMRPKYTTLRNGRTVYGGGGITPDIIIEKDSSLVTSYILKMIAKGVLADYMYNYLDRERQSLSKRYTTFDKFDREFEISAEMLDELYLAGEEQGIRAADDEQLDSYRFVRRYIKSFIARALFSNTEYYRVLNEDDKVFAEAVSVMSNPSRISSILANRKP